MALAPGTQTSRSLACRAVARRVGAERRLERETGIEPATNSLEGCDSTTELLPPSLLCHRLAQPKLAKRAKADGEGRIRTSEAARATDLQSAAFDRFATSPIPRPHVSATCGACSGRPTAEGLLFVMSGFAPLANYPCGIGRAEKPFFGARFMELAKGFEPPTG